MHTSKIPKTLCLSLFLLSAIQIGHAAAIQENHALKTTPKSAPLVMKALDQQKRNINLLPSSDDELKVLHTLRTKPTQNFFAAQNQRFSRFVQTLFQQQTS